MATSPARKKAYAKWRQKPESKLILAKRQREKRLRDKKNQELVTLYRETLVQVASLWKDTREIIDPVLEAKA